MNWSYTFYEKLQNTIGGGKEKMQWYFETYGWPSDLETQSADSRREYISELHKKKSELYMNMIREGEAKMREGILRVMDEAFEKGYKVAICSAANAKSVELVLKTLLGSERIGKMDLILAGDVVKRKKPDPLIYEIAVERLGVEKEDCVVVEDSRIGLLAAKGAGLRCVVTYTGYTKSQDFGEADMVVDGLGEGDEEGNGTNSKALSVEDLFGRKQEEVAAA